MKNGQLKYILAFLGMVALQTFLPARMVWKKERVLTEGNTFHFRTAPIDPNDPFRGKYIILSFEDNRFSAPQTPQFETNETIYVRIEEGAEGHAEITGVYKKAPTDTPDYIKTKVRYANSYDDFQEITVIFPFERFYMEESKAPIAEERYQDALRNPEQRTFAVVRINRGEAVLKDILVNDVPLLDALAEED